MTMTDTPYMAHHVVDQVAQLRHDLAKANASLMELEEDAQLMWDLKREIKGLDVKLSTNLPQYQGSQKGAGSGVTQKLMTLWRRIQTEADMEKGAA